MSPLRLMSHLFMYIMCINALKLGPDSRTWDVAVMGVMLLNVVLMVRSFIKGEKKPALTPDQKLEISRQKTAELEKELGYEPLNLHELDDIITEKKSE